MKLGVHVGYWRLGMGPQDQLEVVREAERLGYDSVNAFVSDDVELARNLMRPVLALCIGGMGSRDQNFYNQLVQRYGFEDAARELQDLYLDAKKAEASAAIPIDLVSLCGPRDAFSDRSAAFRDPGVGTLMITPMAFSVEDRIDELRAIAEPAA